ncbi:MAG: VOC family protein, partial [Planctomycetes bacterium]|nr:VOC family protein [Planctomycetota bacterium]
MQVKHLDHLNMGVIDLDQTIDWYRRVFGFRVVERKFSGGVDWAVIRSGEAMLCLYEHPEFSRYNAQALYREKRLAIAHFGMRITDAEAWQR